MLKTFGKNILIALFLMLVIGLNPLAVTKVQAFSPEAKVSITFDDGFLTTYTNALPILASRNIPATIYPATNFIDNGITADGQPAMSWTQLKNLQDNYGWEVGAHTDTHPELPLLTQTLIAAQFNTSNAKLAAHSLTITDLATPFGAYDNKTLVEALKLYESHRAFADRIALNSFPYNKADIQVQSLESNVTPAVVKGWIDQAIVNKQWLVIVAHDTQPAYTPTYIYTVSTSDLTTIADYIKSTGIKVQTVHQAVQLPGTNVLTNSTFDNTLTGWTVDNATQVTLDKNNNGAYGTAETAVKVTGSTSASHLFSNLVSNVSGASYLVESFYNTIGVTSGELGFYVDEYDTSNNWISGQWLGQVANNAIGYFDKVFNATSALVSQFRVQTYLTANAVGSAFVDNQVLQNLDAVPISAPVTPTPAPSIVPSATPTPTPVPTGNLIANPTFDNGIIEGWISDDVTNVSLDTNNNGSSPSAKNSVKMTGSTGSSHLFYGFIPVDTTANYLFQAFANTKALTSGELGFYIDEYDVNGTWLSGQWLGLVANNANTNFSKVFKATSSLVNNIRIQTYLFQNANGSAFVDNYSFVNQSAPIPTPIPSPSSTPLPSVTPTPTPGTNLVPNFSFEILLNAWADLWTTDNASFTVDTSSKGNNGTNSIHLITNPLYAHLFSQKIAIDSTKTYAWKQNIKATGSGEFGFYIDEYDASNVWISGQWKGMIAGVTAQDVQFNYIPTSTNVKNIGLQYYATPGSNFDLFLDSIFLTAN